MTSRELRRNSCLPTDMRHLREAEEMGNLMLSLAGCNDYGLRLLRGIREHGEDLAAARVLGDPPLECFKLFDAILT